MVLVDGVGRGWNLIGIFRIRKFEVVIDWRKDAFFLLVCCCCVEFSVWLLLYICLFDLLLLKCVNCIWGFAAGGLLLWWRCLIWHLSWYTVDNSFKLRWWRPYIFIFIFFRLSKNKVFKNLRSIQNENCCIWNHWVVVDVKVIILVVSSLCLKFNDFNNFCLQILPYCFLFHFPTWGMGRVCFPSCCKQPQILSFQEIVDWQFLILGQYLVSFVNST